MEMHGHRLAGLLGGGQGLGAVGQHGQGLGQAGGGQQGGGGEQAKNGVGHGGSGTGWVVEWSVVLAGPYSAQLRKPAGTSVRWAGKKFR